MADGPYNMGLYPARRDFKRVYCAIILRIMYSIYINHSETPTNLNYVRPALALSYWNIVWLLHYLAGEVFMLMPYKPACPGAMRSDQPPRPIGGTTCSDQPIKPLSQVWARGLGQGHNKKRYPYPPISLKINRLGLTMTWP